MASWERALFWAPRVLAILFAGFLLLFAADVFAEGGSVGATVVALAFHLIPSLVILLLLTIAWRRERLGSVLFAACGALYLAGTRGRWLVVPAPLFFIAVLFYAHWWLSRRRGVA